MNLRPADWLPPTKLGVNTGHLRAQARRRPGTRSSGADANAKGHRPSLHDGHASRTNAPKVRLGVRAPAPEGRPRNVDAERPWIWSGEGQEGPDQLASLFGMIDKEYDGMVTSTELMHMLINLGEDVDEKMVEDMVRLVDLNGDGEIDFAEFFAVVCGRFELGELPESCGRSQDKNVNQMSTTEMRNLFLEMDEDGSGYLDKYEVQQLAGRVGHRIASRHVVDAMKAMDPEDTNMVTFDMFRNWLIDAGRHWSDLMVLPEASVFAIREQAAQVLPQDDVAALTLHVRGVGGLLEQELIKLFSKFGPVTRVTVRHRKDDSGENTSWALVTFEEPRAVELVLKATILAKDTGKRLDVNRYSMKQAAASTGAMALKYSSHTSALKTALAVVMWRRLGLLLKLASYASDKWGTPSEIRRFFTKSEGVGRRADSDESLAHLDAKEMELEVRVQPCLVSPESRFRASWDIAQVFLLLYVVLTVPLRIGFDIEVEFGTAAFWIDAYVDLYFLVDIGVNFRTAYYDKHGIMIINRTKIMWEYIKGWCLIDIVSCLPISYISMAIQNSSDVSRGGGREVRLFKMLRLLRLAKLLRIARITRMLDRYREELRPLMDTFGGFFLCILIALFSHFVACLWYMVGKEHQNGVSGITGEQIRVPGWVERKFRCGEHEPGFASGGNALNDTEFHHVWDRPSTILSAAQAEPAWCDYNDSIYSRYLISTYWALMTIATVGYGDITGHTDTELIFSFGVMLFGAIIFAMITGKIASQMMSQKGAVQEYNTRMDLIRQFLQNKQVPTSQRRHVLSYYEALYTGRHVYDERMVLGKLPLAISGPVIACIYNKAMESVAFFRTLSQAVDGREIMVKLCLQLQHVVALPHDHVMQEGRVGNCMYLIEGGEVDVYKRSRDNPDSKLRLGRLGPKCYFGERAVMSSSGGSHIRVRTVIARTTCHFAVLKKETIDDLRKDYETLNSELLHVESPIETPFNLAKAHVSSAQVAETPIKDVAELQLWIAKKIHAVNSSEPCHTQAKCGRTRRIEHIRKTKLATRVNAGKDYVGTQKNTAPRMVDTALPYSVSKPYHEVQL